MRFWDSSAIVPLAVIEEYSPVVRSLLDDDLMPVVWWGASVECASGLARIQRERARSGLELLDAEAVLAAFWETTLEIGPEESVRRRALRLLASHPLRAADALQLGAALTWRRDRPSRTGFVCLDAQLRDAAAREGFTVLPAAM